MLSLLIRILAFKNSNHENSQQLEDKLPFILCYSDGASAGIDLYPMYPLSKTIFRNLRFYKWLFLLFRKILQIHNTDYTRDQPHSKIKEQIFHTSAKHLTLSFFIKSFRCIKYYQRKNHYRELLLNNVAYFLSCQGFCYLLASRSSIIS